MDPGGNALEIASNGLTTADSVPTMLVTSLVHSQISLQTMINSERKTD